MGWARASPRSWRLPTHIGTLGTSGILAYQVFLISMNALVYWVVPIGVVTLGRGKLDVEVLPHLPGFRRGLGRSANRWCGGWRAGGSPSRG